MFVTLGRGLGVRSAFLTPLAAFFPAEGTGRSNNIKNVIRFFALTLS